LDSGGDFIVEGDFIKERMESQGIWKGNGLAGDKTD